MKIEDEDPEIVQLELKYCERCGALWLRLRGAPRCLLRSVRSGGAGPALTPPGSEQATLTREPQGRGQDAADKRTCVLRTRGNRMTLLPGPTPSMSMRGDADVTGKEPQRCRLSARSGPRSQGSEAAPVPDRDPDLWLYRDRTLGLLRRYLQLSVEVGRLPSLLGREFFRTGVTSYRATTFEDTVIFVHDVARGLERLEGFENKLIARIVLQDYTQNETARLLGAGRVRWDGASPKPWIN